MFFLSSATRNTLFISLIVCGISVAVLLLGWRFLVNSGQQYAHELQMVANADQVQLQAKRISSVLESSATARDSLDDYFLDTIQIAQFLEQIEAFSARTNLELESGTLSSSEPNEWGLATVDIPYEITGATDEVLEFVQILESLPYHSSVQSIQMSRSRASDTIQIRAVLRISYLQHE